MYMIVSAETTMQLSEAVNKWVKDGKWKPIGGIAVSDTLREFYQAMILE